MLLECGCWGTIDHVVFQWPGCGYQRTKLTNELRCLGCIAPFLVLELVDSRSESEIPKELLNFYIENNIKLHI